MLASAEQFSFSIISNIRENVKGFFKKSEKIVAAKCPTKLPHKNAGGDPGALWGDFGETSAHKCRDFVHAHFLLRQRRRGGEIAVNGALQGACFGIGKQGVQP